MRTRHRKHLIRALSFVAAAAIIAAPAGAANAAEPHSVQAADPTSSPTSGKDAKTMRIATSGFVDSFNPWTSIYLLPTNLFRYMYENLVQNSDVDGSPTKGLADHWKVEEGGKKWVYTLQDGLTWSDGKAITSADVKYTFDQMMTNPDLAVANGNFLANFSDVKAPDAKTVVIDLKAPQAPNPGIEVPILPKHVWEKISDPATYANDKDVVGSGPFLLESYKANQFITMKANPKFWKGAPKIDTIQYVYYTNSDAQVQALRSGDVDFVTGLTPTQYQALKGAEGITEHSGIGRRFSSLSFNSGVKTVDGQPFGNGNPALQDVNVRQAIRMGTDTKTLLSKVLNGLGNPGTSFIPSSYPQWTLPTDDSAVKALAYSPDKAKAKLDAAGWKVGADGIRVKDGQRLSLRLFVDSTDPQEQTVAQYFQPWMKTIGIDIQPISTDSDTINADTLKGNYDIYFSGWSVGPDPDYQLSINTCSSLPTKTDGTGATSQDGWCNPEYDKLYKEQQTETDAKKREAIVQKMLQLNFTDTAQIVYWYANGLEAYRSDRFTDFRMMPAKGGIIANQSGYWGFMDVAPVGDGASSDSGPNVGLLVTGGVIVLIVIGAIIFFVVRRRSSADVE
ncbi:ABC transporter substrate-binding protein [Leifsonia sp. PS1209]|uniref:ABC transporter substrate-binding protein n=1 Tax=Leifsonia sp. PS1209 TaxID=2724914 RepID=UPI001442DEE5|nr:ABC transporter substrate-binding protein [Leifsonia sp. PS1209]QJA00307.1 ABC transporter substrate-binding protein [Leifsonia sp. PS1209]